MKLTKQEVDTILAGLSYLQSNRDDAIEALFDLNNSEGEYNEDAERDARSSILTEDKIENLRQRISLCDDLTFTN